MVITRCTTRSRTRSSFFFFNDTATTEIYTLSLHDALPIFYGQYPARDFVVSVQQVGIFENLSTKDGPKEERQWRKDKDRKSTRLNSSHSQISYAVFCLKKKKHSPLQPAQRRPGWPRSVVWC